MYSIWEDVQAVHFVLLPSEPYLTSTVKLSLT